MRGPACNYCLLPFLWLCSFQPINIMRGSVARQLGIEQVQFRLTHCVSLGPTPIVSSPGLPLFCSHKHANPSTVLPGDSPCLCYPVVPRPPPVPDSGWPAWSSLSVLQWLFLFLLINPEDFAFPNAVDCPSHRFYPLTTTPFRVPF